ncbi:hypothetical protein Taro_043212, partial [Colocasia esculenta]|nr:hypothetical protein [Colocasia esculenta]
MVLLEGVAAVVFHSALFPPPPWVFIWQYSSVLEGRHCDFDALLREAILEENAMFLAVGEMLMSCIMDEDEEDITPIPRPMHTSRHTGHVWVHKVLHGHEHHCYNTFRMHPSMFLKLRDILMERELIRDSRYVTTTEQLAMFLYAMGHGVATGAMCEHFQHSSETISFYVNHVIKAISLLRFTYIVLPTRTDLVHHRIRHDDRFYPYFKELTYSMGMLKEESLTHISKTTKWLT